MAGTSLLALLDDFAILSKLAAKKSAGVLGDDLALNAQQVTGVSTARVGAGADPDVDLVAFEREKIKGAVRTDFILSAEIIAITLGVVAVAMTVGVCGLVAGIVKLDDLGLYWSRASGAFRRAAALANAAVGIVAGAIVLSAVLASKRLVAGSGAADAGGDAR